MTYRENARKAGAPQHVGYFRYGPVLRFVVLAPLVAGLVVVGFMLRMAADDAELACRHVGTSTHCVLRETVLGLRSETPLPALRDVDVEARAGSAGGRGARTPRTYYVLVLEHSGAPPTELHAVGERGMRASSVASDLRDYMSAPTRGPRTFQAREPMTIVSVLLLAAGACLMCAFGMPFQRIRVRFDPRERRVDVRVGRWPFRARVSSFALDELTQVHRGSPTDATLPRIEADGRFIDLGMIGAQVYLDRVANGISSALQGWRDATRP